MIRYYLHYGKCEHQCKIKCAFNIGGNVTVMSDERSSTGLLNMNGFCYNTFTEWVFLIFIFCFRDEFLNDTVLFVLWARFLS